MFSFLGNLQEMSFLRSSLARSTPLFQTSFRTYASQNDQVQSLLLAARKGHVVEAEKLAKGLTANRQVNAALASTYLADQDFEKAREFTKRAQESQK